LRERIEKMRDLLSEYARGLDTAGCGEYDFFENWLTALEDGTMTEKEVLSDITKRYSSNNPDIVAEFKAERESLEKRFIKFLTKNNAYRQFMHNLAYVEDGKMCWDEYKECTNEEDWILGAFDFSKTKEGSFFWYTLTTAWKKIKIKRDSSSHRWEFY
jgi:hypothetical protein